MSNPPIESSIVRVAVGGVVEKMSTVSMSQPPTASTPPWHGTPAEQLRVLITKRKPEQVLGGLWELPGGKIEPDETPQQSVVRELKEEVGLDTQPIAELPPVLHTYEHATVMLLPMICRRIAGLPQALDVADVRWVALDQLDQYAFPQASLPVIDTLRKHLAEHLDLPGALPAENPAR